MGLILSFGSAAWAKEPKSKSASAASPGSVEVATETHSTHHNSYGVGLASLGDSVALAGYFKLDSMDGIEAYFAMPSTSPFEMTLGGSFKHTILESQNAGVHIGGGFTLGAAQGSTSVNILTGTTSNSTAFALGIRGLGGIHFNFSDIPHLMFSFDGGPTFSVVDGHANFAIGGLSSLLGVSAIYMF